jgi:fused signal recognition particle receptor
MKKKKGLFSRKKEGKEKKKGFFSRFGKTHNESRDETDRDKPNAPEPAVQKQVNTVSEDVISGVEMSLSEEHVSQDLEKPDAGATVPIVEPDRTDSMIQHDIPKKKFFSRLKEGLSKTRLSLKSKLGGVFAVGRKIDEDLYEELEEMLITSDLGIQTTMDLIEKVRRSVDRKQLKDGGELKKELKKILLQTFEEQVIEDYKFDRKPMIVMIVGVNGVGKTTTIGKMATFWKNQGKRVLVCAADTFRAAAVEQLQIWAERAGVDLVLKEGSTDPASVVFDALAKARTGNYDMLLIDTAGRLHNNPNLMNELEKMYKVVGREYENAPHHVFLILDAITGQNGLQQAKQFVSKVAVSDLVITKLDGTAKGGVAVAISNELNLPIRFIGVGERQEDLLEFSPQQFVDSLFDEGASSAVSTRI